MTADDLPIAEAAALLGAIWDDPDNDIPRLVYADWLQERGDPYGEFIRAQVVRSQSPGRLGVIDMSRLEVELSNVFPEAWIQTMAKEVGPQRKWRRGFLNNVIRMRAEDFLNRPEERWVRVPIPRVRLAVVGPYLRDLAECPWMAHVIELEVEDESFDDDALGLLVQSPYLKNLRVLRLVGKRLGYDGMRALAESPSCQRLKELDLSDNRIGDEGLAAFTDSPNCASLLRLYLQRNRIGPSGAEMLARSRHLGYLDELWLFGNGIDRDSAAARALRKRFGSACRL